MPSADQVPVNSITSGHPSCKSKSGPARSSRRLAPIFEALTCAPACDKLTSGHAGFKKLIAGVTGTWAHGDPDSQHQAGAAPVEPQARSGFSCVTPSAGPGRCACEVLFAACFMNL